MTLNKIKLMSSITFVHVDYGLLEEFIAKIKNFDNLKQTELIEYFTYFLTAELKQHSTNATQIRECFLRLRLSPYSNISAYLTNNLKGRAKQPPKFIRDKSGYLLHRSLQEKIRQTLKENLLKVKVNRDLRNLLSHLDNSDENDFLKEAIDCFEISAYRAAIIMVWNLTLDHLHSYILKHELPSFNTALAKNTDKRIKISTISKKDDYSEIPEAKFIDFCRSANIISNDVRKILEAKLGTRNTYAHPSNVKMIESKALEFIEDLINNVVLKYKI
jgi:hypothetical protein